MIESAATVMMDPAEARRLADAAMARALRRGVVPRLPTVTTAEEYRCAAAAADAAAAISGAIVALPAVGQAGRH